MERAAVGRAVQHEEVAGSAAGVFEEAACLLQAQHAPAGACTGRGLPRAHQQLPCAPVPVPRMQPDQLCSHALRRQVRLQVLSHQQHLFRMHAPYLQAFNAHFVQTVSAQSCQACRAELCWLKMRSQSVQK